MENDTNAEVNSTAGERDGAVGVFVRRKLSRFPSGVLFRRP